MKKHRTAAASAVIAAAAIIGFTTHVFAVPVFVGLLLAAKIAAE